jgi:hypothetical protein
MKKIIQERKNFNNSKKNYYKHINSLLEKLDRQIESKDKDTIEECEKEDFLIEKLQEKCNKHLDREMCTLCNLKEHLYVCPKCKVKYCSLDCYKKHNSTCTEEFYKGNVIEELKVMKTEKEEVKKFKGNLKRVLENEADNEDKYPDFISESRRKKLENLLNKIENNNLDINSDLTPDDWRELKEFIKNLMNNSGDNKLLQNYILLWKPYWLSDELTPSFDVSEKFDIFDEKSRENLKNCNLNEFLEFYKSDENEEENDLTIDDQEPEENEEIESDDEVLEEGKKNNQRKNDKMDDNVELKKDINEKIFEEEAKMFIEINGEYQKISRDVIIKSIMLKYQILPRINSVTKIVPNKNNLYTVVYIIAGIVYIFRLYNGDISENINEIFQYFLQILYVLYDKNIVFNSVNEAITELFSKLSIKRKNEFEDTKKLIESDLEKINEVKFYMIESLLRLYEVLHKFEGMKIKKIHQRNVILSKHKLIYYLSYVKSLNNDCIQNIKKEVSDYFTTLREVNNIGNKIKKMNIINK